MARRVEESSRRRITLDQLVVTRRSDVPVVLDHLPADDVLLQDAPGTDLVDVRIPYIFRIDDDHGSVTALVHAAGVIDSHLTPRTGGSDSLLENRMHLNRSVERACLSAGAYENVTPVLTHRTKMSGQAAR
jgi:hypothetical protein